LGLHGGVGALRKTRQGRSEAVGGQEARRDGDDDRDRRLGNYTYQTGERFVGWAATKVNQDPCTRRELEAATVEASVVLVCWMAATGLAWPPRRKSAADVIKRAVVTIITTA
jgi:hypothetical protein